MGKADGFSGQRIQVLARPVVREALTRPVTGALVVTDCGYFPTAADHWRERPHGSPAAIFMVCTEGGGWVELGDQRHSVTTGQVVVVPPDQPHRYGADAQHPWTIWWAHVTGADTAGLLEAAGVTAATAVFNVADPPRLARLVELALEFMERDASPASLQGAAGAMWQLLALLPSQRRAPRDRPDPIAGVLRLLRDQPERAFSVDQLAESAMLSTSHFAALFRKATGCGVLQYQTSLRMNKARVLLDSTDWPITKVARQVGYHDPFYFSRKFHQTHGLSPTEYRAAAKG
ncbi:MAG: AraC family transcriptional regulator [Propionibacteriaceae bacterium]|jgi:AraC-like DNA-binding protein|nr:AraC family transcriptional regulator [Propionibacteriaceae bacterium]